MAKFNFLNFPPKCLLRFVCSNQEPVRQKQLSCSVSMYCISPIANSCCHLTHSFITYISGKQKVRSKNVINFRLNIFGKNTSCDAMNLYYITFKAISYNQQWPYYQGCYITRLRSVDMFDIISDLRIFEMVFSLKDRQ